MRNTLASLWPHHCVSCGQGSEPEIFCEPCMMTLIPGSEAGCPRCGRVYLVNAADGGSQICGKCLKDPPLWDKASTAYAYGGPLRDAICSWKNGPDITLGSHLARLMLKQAQPCGWADLPSDTVVIPVPSPTSHGFRRGFLPSGVLAFHLAKRFDFSFRPKALGLSHQVLGAKGMNKSARERRIQNAMKAKISSIRGKKVLLVDDVLTTGSTMKAAAHACAQAGPKSIDVAVLATTPLS